MNVNDLVTHSKDYVCLEVEQAGDMGIVVRGGNVTLGSETLDLESDYLHVFDVSDTNTRDALAYLVRDRRSEQITVFVSEVLDNGSDQHTEFTRVGQYELLAMVYAVSIPRYADTLDDVDVTRFCLQQ